MNSLLFEKTPEPKKTSAEIAVEEAERTLIAAINQSLEQPPLSRQQIEANAKKLMEEMLSKFPLPPGIEIEWRLWQTRNSL